MLINGIFQDQHILDYLTFHQIPTFPKQISNSLIFPGFSD